MNEIATLVRATDLLKKRHHEAFRQLRIESEIPVLRYGSIKASNIIAKKLNISYQTVINYMASPGKDGFLTEAITEEFKNLNALNNQN